MEKLLKNNKPKLLISWCSYEAAKYATTMWHYSKCMPAGITAKLGVWENNKFIGVVIFALGANAKIYRYKGLITCELARVALTKHNTPVTRIVAISLKMLSKKYPRLEQVISYADRDQNHEGTIYTAGNWTYENTVVAKHLLIKNKICHPRSVFAKYGTHGIEWLKKNVDANAKYVETKGKKKFLFLLNRAGSKENVALPYQGKEDGVNPIPALQQNSRAAK